MTLLLYNILSSLLLCFKGIDKDIKTGFSPKALLSVLNNKSFTYPVKIRNSHIGNIEFGEGCIISDSICRGKVKLGKFVSINGPWTIVNSEIYGINIGSFSSIGSNVLIIENYHKYDRATSYFIFTNIFKEGIEKDISSKGKISIQEDVWICANSVILSGVTIGRGSIVGAGSVVTKDVSPYTIVGGNPAKVIRKRFSQKTIDYLEDSRWWDKEIKDLLKQRAFFSETLI